MQKRLNISPTDENIDCEFGTLPPPANLRQLRCYVVAKAISRYCAENGGNSPTMRELAGILKRQRRTICLQMDQLRSFGLAVRRNHKYYLVGGKWTPPDWIDEE